MLRLDKSTGCIVKCDLASIKFCIFLYGKEEDNNIVVTRCPLIFDSHNKLLEYLVEYPNKVQNWYNQNLTIVIRKLELEN